MAVITASAATTATCLDIVRPVARVPHRAHWQPGDLQRAARRLERWFEPVDDNPTRLAGGDPPTGLVAGTGQAGGTMVHRSPPVPGGHHWGIGRPTPEGAHRDGVDFVAVLMLGRHQIKGGEPVCSKRRPTRRALPP